MGAAENKAIISGMYEAFGRGDIGAVLAALADDVIWTNHSTAASPLSGEFKGTDRVQQFFEALDAIEITKFDPHTLLADGNHVVALLEEQFNVKATGKSHEGPLVHVFEFSDGKVARFDEFESDSGVW